MEQDETVLPKPAALNRRFGYTAARVLSVQMQPVCLIHLFVRSACSSNLEVTVVATSDAAAGLPLAFGALNTMLLSRLAQDAADLLGAALAPLGLRWRHFAVL